MDPGDGGARLEELEARLLQGDLGHDGPRSLHDLHGIDDVDRLGQRLGFLGDAGGRGHGDLGFDRKDLEDDLDRLRGAGDHGDGRAALDETGNRDRDQVMPGGEILEDEAAFRVGPGAADHGLFAAQKGDAGPGDGLARRIADASGQDAGLFGREERGNGQNAEEEENRGKKRS